MKKVLVILFALLSAVACGSDRPDNTATFTVSVIVHSITTGGTVSIFTDGKKVVSKQMEDHSVSFSDLSLTGHSSIEVCGGSWTLISTDNTIPFDGCLTARFSVTEKQQTYVISVDMISTLIAAYNSKTAAAEWMDYLSLTKTAVPEQSSTLGDATKSYLWQQALSLVAKEASSAKGVGVETSLSTEKLLQALVNDLSDNNIVDGSTKETFGNYPIDASIIKQLIPKQILSVPSSFSEEDTEEWREHLITEKAKFLGKQTDYGGTSPTLTIMAPSEDTVHGTIRIEAQAEDEEGVDYVRCKTDRGTLEEIAEPENAFSAILNTTNITDGSLTIQCTASDGIHTTTVKKSVLVSNHNAVKVSVYVHEPVTDIGAVRAYDLNNVLVAESQPDEDGKITIDVPAGTYIFKVKGGKYASNIIVAPDDQEQNEPQTTFYLENTLSSRATVVPGITNRVFVNPITTIREMIFNALVIKGESVQEASDHSLLYLQQHYGQDFNPYITPRFDTPGANSTTTFVAIAALEYQANAISTELHKNHGFVTLTDMLRALQQDLESDTIFNGKDNKGFPLYVKETYSFDSYFYRLFNAAALRSFIDEETTADSNNFSVISSISKDSSPLFPTDQPAKTLGKSGVVIANKQFKRDGDTQWHDYNMQHIVYSRQVPFFFRFTAEPVGMFDITDIFITSDEVEQIGDITKSGQYYTVKLVYSDTTVDGDDQNDGLKSFVINATDQSGATSTSPVDTMRDTIPPTLELSKIPDDDYVGLPFSVDYEAHDRTPMTVQSGVALEDDIPDSFKTLPHTAATKEFSKEDVPEDGKHTFYIRVIDSAGNSTEQHFSKTTDTTPPHMVAFSTEPELTNGICTSSTINITVSAEDNITEASELVFSHSLDGSTFTTFGADGFSEKGLTEGDHTIVVDITDECGNKTENSLSFTVDYMLPTVHITNRDDLKNHTFPRTSDELIVQYSATDSGSGLAHCTLQVNEGAKNPLFIPSGTASLTNHPDLVEGENKVTISCTDKAGFEASAVLSPFFIDSTVPSFTIVAKNNGWNPDQEQLETFSGTTDERRFSGTVLTSEQRYNVEWDIACPSVNFSRHLDFGTMHSLNLLESAALPEDSVNGYHCSVAARVKDASGNIGIAPAVRWIVDRKAPIVHWNLQSNYSTGDISFDLSFNEPVYGSYHSCELYVDGARVYFSFRDSCTTYDSYSAKGCSLPHLEDGTHTISFLSADTIVGNRGSVDDCKANDYSCVSKEVTVDSSAPNVKLIFEKVTKDLVKFNLSSSSYPQPTVSECDIAQAATWPMIGLVHLKDCAKTFGSQTVSLDGVGDNTKQYIVRIRVTKNDKHTDSFNVFTIDTEAPVIMDEHPVDDKYLYRDDQNMKVTVSLAHKEKSISGSLSLGGRSRVVTFERTVDENNIPITSYMYDLITEDIHSSYSVNVSNASTFTTELTLPSDDEGTFHQLTVSVTDDAGNRSERIFSLNYNHVSGYISGQTRPFTYQKSTPVHTVDSVPWLALLFTHAEQFDFTQAQPFFASTLYVPTVRFFVDNRELEFTTYTLRHVCWYKRDKATMVRSPRCFFKHDKNNQTISLYCEPAVVNCWIEGEGTSSDYQEAYYSWPSGKEPENMDVKIQTTNEHGGYEAVFLHGG